MALQRFGLIFLVALCAVVVVWANAFPSQPQAPDEILIHSQGWTEKKHEDTKLSHKKHAAEFQIACTECHHVYKDGNNVWKEGNAAQKCEVCHTFIKTGKALKDATPEEQKLSLYNAFHSNCVNCHKEKAKGPAKCLECHPKKKKK
jgi:hypothetical protein